MAGCVIVGDRYGRQVVRRVSGWAVDHLGQAAPAGLVAMFALRKRLWLDLRYADNQPFVHRPAGRRGDLLRRRRHPRPHHESYTA